jgi:serine/threonine-protein kinase
MIKIGDKLGHFLIQAEIGKGGMGTIYYALDTMLNREVALKAIHPQLADNQQLMDRFKIEAMTQARMNHPNIVTIFSFNRIDDQYIIAMEYVEGKSLKELLQTKKMLKPGEAVAIIIQVAEGLAYAHAHNVIHRDIKPANILLDKDNRVKISDFGIAKIFGAEGLTKTGMMMGTPWYTPPEQIMGKNIDFRADLYSLGVTFYELMTSRVPFDSETNSEFQIQKAHLETPPPRPSIFNPQIGAKLERIILQALQKKVEKRYQSAGEMITELKKLQIEIGKTDPPDFSPVGHTQVLEAPTVKRRHFRRSPLKAVAFLILVLAAAIAWVFLSGKIGRHEKAGVVATETRQRPADGSGSPQIPAEQRLAGVAGAKDASAQEARGGETDSESKKPTAAPAETTSAAGGAAAPPQTQTVAGTPQGVTQEKGQPKDDGPAVSLPPPVESLGSLDSELIRLRGFLARRNLLAADRLADALLQSTSESRILPLLGNVKFFLNKFAAAEQLWSKSLQANQMVSLELLHVHDAGGDFCTGQLKFKKKVILYSSDTRGDHSLALQAGNIQSLRLGDDLRITITATINGQEINESFMLEKKFQIVAREKFLVDFLNKYVL